MNKVADQFLNGSLSVYLKRRIILVAFLGFSAGLPLSLTGSTLTVWLTDHKIDPSTIGLLALTGVPYSLKFFWSQILDHMPIPLLTAKLGKRRSWILLTQFFLIYCIYSLGGSNPATNVYITAFWAFLIAICSASQDIAIDAYRIELLDEEEQGAGAASYVFGYRMGMLVAAGGAIFLVAYLQSNTSIEYLGTWGFTYNIMALCIVVGMVATIMAPNTDKEQALKSQYDKKVVQNIPALQGEDTYRLKMLVIFLSVFLMHYSLWHYKDVVFEVLTLHDIQLLGWYKDTLHIGPIFYFAYYTTFSFLLVGSFVTCITGKSMKYVIYDPFIDFTHHKKWFVIILFIILYKFGDAFAGRMTPVFVLDINFSKADYGAIVKLYGTIATLVGAFIGGILVKQKGIFLSLWICGLLQMFSNLLFAVLSYYQGNIMMLGITVTIENFSGGMGTTAFVAYLATLCNKEFTATQYALLSSCAGLAQSFLVGGIFFVDANYIEGATLIDRIGWSAFFILTTIAAIPGLVMLVWLTLGSSKYNANFKKFQKYMN